MLLLKFKDVEILLFNVYLPYESSSNADDFLLQLAIISDIIERYPYAQVILGGDLNTDFNRDGNQTQILREFSTRNGLIPCSQLTGYDVDYTYHLNCERFSILEHFMLSASLAGAPELRVGVTHPVDNTSDHEPVTLYLPLHVDRIRSVPSEYTRTFAWYKCTSKQLKDYADYVNETLDCLNVPTASLACTDIFCNCLNHLEELQTYGSAIIQTCLNAAHSFIPYVGATNRNRIAGWAAKVQPHKDKALFWNHIWNEMNRPRNGVVAQIRRQTRAMYHAAIRSAIRGKIILLSLSLLSAYLRMTKEIFGMR